MAVKIPSFQELGFADPRAAGRLPSYPGEDPGALAGAQLGKGLQAAGGALIGIDEERRRKRDKLEQAMADADLVGSTIRLTEQLKVETDPAKIDEIKAGFAQAHQRAGGAIGDPETRQLWSALHSKTVAAGEAQADLRQTAIYRDRYGAGIDEQAADKIRLAAASGDPVAIRLAFQAVRGLYEAGKENGVYTAEQEQAKRQAAERQLLVGGIGALINRGQVDAAEKLSNEHASDLDPIAMEALRRRIETAKDKGIIKGGIDSEWGGTDKGYAGPRAGKMSVGEMKAAAVRAGFKGEAADIIAATAMAESGGDPNAIGDRNLGGSYGLTQIHEPAHGPVAREALGNPDRAMQLAFKVSKGGTDFSPWTMYKNGGYRKYLGEAKGAAAPDVGEDVASGSSTAPAPDAASQPPLPDIEAMIGRVQGRVDKGEITQEQANGIQAGLRARYNNLHAAQANQRASLTKRLENGAAMLADGREFEYDPAEVRHFFPKERADEILTTLEDAKEGGRIAAGVRTSSMLDLQQQRAQLAAGLEDPNATNYARRRKMLSAFDAAKERHIKELTSDPAGYVARYSPAVATARAAVDPAKPETFAAYATASLAEQARLGMPPEDRSILSAGEAAARAAQITAIDPAKQDPAQVMAAVAKSYGEYWPQVFGDLNKHGKLPGGYMVLGSMTRPDQIVAASDLSRAMALVSEKGGMAVLKKAVPDTVQKKIDTLLDGELAAFRESTGMQAGGPELYAKVRHASQALAYYYGFRNQGESEAVRNAVNGIINNKYDFGTIGAGQVRVPKGTLAEVDRAAVTVQKNINIDQLPGINGNPLLTTKERKEIWLGAIQRGGWVNNEDDSGLVLMGKFTNGAQSVIRTADGNRVEIKFDAVPSINAAADAVPIEQSVPVLEQRRRSQPLVPPGSTVIPAPTPP